MMATLVLLPTDSRNIRSSTGIGSWRIGGTDQSYITWNQTLDLIGMDASMMVTTGSKSGPCRMFLSGGVESQCVSRLNFEDLAPTQGNLREWIGDGDTLIEDFEFWLMNCQVDKSSENDAGDCCPDDVIDICCHKGLQQRTAQERVSDVGHYDRRGRTEHLNIGHEGLAFVDGTVNE